MYFTFCKKRFIKTISSIISSVFILSSVGAGDIFALPPQSIYRPAENGNYAIAEWAKLDAVYAAQLLCERENIGLKQINLTLKAVFEARRRSVSREPWAARGIKLGAVEFTDSYLGHTKNGREVIAVFTFKNSPNKFYQIDYISGGEYKIKPSKSSRVEIFSGDKFSEVPESARERIASSSSYPELVNARISSSGLKMAGLDALSERISKNPIAEADKFLKAGYPGEHMPAILCDASNYLLWDASSGKLEASSLDTFFSAILENLNAKNSAFQYRKVIPDIYAIAGQAGNITQLMQDNVTAGNMRLIASPGEMLTSEDADRGLSYLKRDTMPTGAATKEGNPGTYYRGSEGIEKLGQNILNQAIYDNEIFETLRSAVRMYIMLHGAVKIPEKILEATKRGEISTLHLTTFLLNSIPGSLQTTSTGPGHFQGKKIDIKFAVGSGEAVQCNNIYSPDGKLIKVIAQYIRPGEWFVALPGAVDSVVNIKGKLRFYDFSILVPDETLRQLNPWFDFKNTENAEVKIKEKLKGSDSMPLVAINNAGDETVLVKNDLGLTADKIEWVNAIPDEVFGETSILELYKRLDTKRIHSLLVSIAGVVSGNGWIGAEPLLDMVSIEEVSTAARSSTSGLTEGAVARSPTWDIETAINILKSGLEEEGLNPHATQKRYGREYRIQLIYINPVTQDEIGFRFFKKDHARDRGSVPHTVYKVNYFTNGMSYSAGTILDDSGKLPALARVALTALKELPAWQRAVNKNGATRTSTSGELDKTLARVAALPYFKDTLKGTAGDNIARLKEFVIKTNEKGYYYQRGEAPLSVMMDGSLGLLLGLEKKDLPLYYTITIPVDVDFGGRPPYMIKEPTDLASDMVFKNLLAEVLFDGGKSVLFVDGKNYIAVTAVYGDRELYEKGFVIAKGGVRIYQPEGVNVTKEEVFEAVKGYVLGFSDLGTLGVSRVEGPDMAPNPDIDVQDVMEYIDALGQKVRKDLKCDLLPFTTSGGAEHGYLSHDEWRSTSYSVLESIAAMLDDADTAKKFGLDSMPSTMLIQGLGEVGGNIIRLLSEREEEYAKYNFKIAGVAEKDFAFYCEEGLPFEDLLGLAEARRNNDKISEKHYLERLNKYSLKDRENFLFQRAKINIPAGPPYVIKNAEDVARLNCKILAPAGNSIFGKRDSRPSEVEELERLVLKRDIISMPSWMANFGGIATSKEELLHRYMERGLAEMTRPEKREWLKAHVLGADVSDIAWLNTFWELYLWKKEGYARPLSAIMKERAGRIKSERKAILMSFADEPLTLEEKLLTMDFATTIAKSRVLIEDLGDYFNDMTLLVQDKSVPLMKRRVAAYLMGRSGNYDYAKTLLAILEDNTESAAMYRNAAASFGYLLEERLNSGEDDGAKAFIGRIEHLKENLPSGPGPLRVGDLERNAWVEWILRKIKGQPLTMDMERQSSSGKAGIFRDIKNDFLITAENMRSIKGDFLADMEKALKRGKSSLKMGPAYIGSPTGYETGEYFVIDVSSARLKIARLILEGNGKYSKPVIKEVDLHASYKVRKGDDLFQFIAESAKEFITEQGMDVNQKLSFTLVWPFPIKKTGPNSGIQLDGTKGWLMKSLLGKKIGDKALEALRKQLPRANISAICNNAEAVLAAGKYIDSNCSVGAIMNNGTNGSIYLGDTAINIEWGGFDLLYKYQTEYDQDLDEASRTRDKQLLEKMTAGAYLAEISRLIIRDLVTKKLLFNGVSPGTSNYDFRFKIEDMSSIEADNSAELNGVKKILEQMGIKSSTLKDRRRVKDICNWVSTRSARILAVVIMGSIEKIDPVLSREHTVSMDGSLYKDYHGFRAKLDAALKLLAGDKISKVKVKFIDNGSTVGAAVMAGVAESSRSSTSGVVTEPDIETIASEVNNIIYQAGDELRKTVETGLSAVTEQPMHLVFIRDSIPEGQPSIVQGYIQAWRNKFVKDSRSLYTVDIKKDVDSVINLLSGSQDWSKADTMIAVDNSNMKALTDALRINGLEGKAKILNIGAIANDELVLIDTYLNLMATLVRINEPLRDEESLARLRLLFESLGVENVNIEKFMKDITSEELFRNSLFILNLPPIKPIKIENLEKLYEATRPIQRSA